MNYFYQKENACNFTSRKLNSKITEIEVNIKIVIPASFCRNVF